MGGPLPVLSIPVVGLEVLDEIRGQGLDETHVARLMEADAGWPPIKVWGNEPKVVDGAHRLAAARRLGRSTILATSFFGTRDEAFLESVRANVTHGLPLSLADRRHAAAEVLKGHIHWSNQRIGEICGLSSNTVARLRGEVGTPLDDGAEIEWREGRDGRVRPLQHLKVRERVLRALAENPTGSLRSIAAVAGVSPETVRTVRSLQRNGLTVVADRAEPDSREPIALRCTQKPDSEVMEQSTQVIEQSRSGRDHFWLVDSALSTSDIGASFGPWFESTHIDDRAWRFYVGGIPLNRIYQVVDEARRRAGAWNDFAGMLEARLRRSS